MLVSLIQLGHRSEPVCLLHAGLDAHGQVHTYGASGLRCILSILCFVLHSAHDIPSVPHNVKGGGRMLLITRHQVQHWWGMVHYLGGSSLPGLLSCSWFLSGRLRLASILAILESGGHISRLLTGHRYLSTATQGTFQERQKHT